MATSVLLWLIAFAVLGIPNDSKIIENFSRSGRWLFYPRTVTKFVEAKSMITESIPSSCVVVQTSLPPCRNVRHLNIQPTLPVRIQQTTAARLPHEISATKLFAVSEDNYRVSSSREDSLESSRVETSPGHASINEKHAPLSWSEYFLGYRNADNPTKGATDESGNPSYNSGLSWGEYFGLEDVTITKTAVNSITAKYLDPNTVVTFSVKGCHPSKLPFNLPLCDNNGNIPLPENAISKDLHYAPN